MTTIDRRGDKRVGFGCAALALAALACLPCARAQEVSIEAGSSWQLGDGAIGLDCATLRVGGALALEDGQATGVGDLHITGQASASSASLEIGGDWINGGRFLAGSGTVSFSDRCDRAAASLRGTTRFSTLTIDSARGKGYRFEAGSTQSVAQALRLAGAPGALVPIGSTFAGNRAGLALDPAGSQSIAWLAVADMTAPEGSAWLAPGAAEDYGSVDAGNNFRWFAAATEPAVAVSVPATSPWALLVLGLAMVLGAGRTIRGSRPPSRPT
jgi:hypothetical protein